MIQITNKTGVKVEIYYDQAFGYMIKEGYFPERGAYVVDVSLDGEELNYFIAFKLSRIETFLRPYGLVLDEEAKDKLLNS